jgi:hypothetical protein
MKANPLNPLVELTCYGTAPARAAPLFIVRRTVQAPSLHGQLTANVEALCRYGY